MVTSNCPCEYCKRKRQFVARTRYNKPEPKKELNLWGDWLEEEMEKTLGKGYLRHSKAKKLRQELGLPIRS